MRRPESSVFTSSRSPSSIRCSSTVAGKPSRLRIFSSVALGSAGIVGGELIVDSYDLTTRGELFLLFLRRRQYRSFGRGRGFRNGPGELGLHDRQEILHRPVERQSRRVFV